MRFQPSGAVKEESESRIDDENEMKGKVHLLWFVPEGEDGEDDALLIGVYASELEANAASQRLKNKPGFSDYAEGFQVHSYEVGQDNWTEGFVRD